MKESVAAAVSDYPPPPPPPFNRRSTTAASTTGSHAALPITTTLHGDAGGRVQPRTSQARRTAARKGGYNPCHM